jgi:trans-aconitate methyltransferase
MSAHGSKADYFSKQAAQYADPRVRPQYPPALYELVFKFAGPSTDAAVDIACGTGQCAQRLADRYQKV